MSEVLNVEKLFGENVFTLGKMQERLPKKRSQKSNASWSMAVSWTTRQRTLWQRR